MNHLLGKESKTKVVKLQELPRLKLQYDKWYDILVEIKGDEVVVQIDGEIFYGRHDLIRKKRPGTFNLDAGGVGYELDSIEIRSAGDYRPGWAAQRKQLAARRDRG